MLCSAVSYFSTRVGSIIGADRLSFRVRDGTGRFPVAISAVTLFSFPACEPWGVVPLFLWFTVSPCLCLVVGCGSLSILWCGCGQHKILFFCVGKFSAG